jgi:hypothetical protein
MVNKNAPDFLSGAFVLLKTEQAFTLLPELI